MKVKLFLAVALAIAAACDANSFTNDDEGGSDAGADVPPVGGGDGSVTDATASDAKLGPSRYCDTQDAQFCADFDIPGDAGAGFEGPFLDGGWTLDFQNALSDSPPTAVEVDVGNGPGAAYIENRHLVVPNYLDAAPSNRIVIEADLYLPAPVFTADLVFLFYGGSVPTPGLQFGLAMHTGEYKLAAWPGGGGSILGVLTPQPETGKWVHAVLGVDLSSSSATVTIDIGAAHASGSRQTTPDSGSLFPGALGVGGFDLYPPNNTFKFFVDNVTARWN